tara:strand:+ start:1067 stop:1696 length:630 start_codon:yes stop_codon:yes gene_type:complete
MARPGSTTSETGNNYQSANGTGAAVRAKLNEIFQALRTISSGSSDPSGAANIAQFQPHINTSTNELKIATAVSGDNATYVVLGKINEANFGHAALTGSTFTGKVTHNYTSSLTIPSGTTAQRDGTPAVGMFRHNATLNQFEGYNNGAWGAIGGGAGATGGGTDEVFFESDQAATTSYSISAGKNALTVSPTINNGVTITVPSGATLVIL